MADRMLDVGADALRRAAWEEARTAFTKAVAEDPSPEAYEGLGSACYWLDDGPATFEARHESFRLYRQGDDRRGAARIAIRLSEDYLNFRNEPAVANGWLLRAERLLDEVEPSQEHVWLRVYQAHFALAEDAARAVQIAHDAADRARSIGSFDLEMLAMALEGFALVHEGSVAQGMERLDEATAAATGGEIQDIEIVPWTCCYLVTACESVRDYDRATQWVSIVRDLSQRWGMRQYLASCLPSYAGVLIGRGDWREAESELAQGTELIRQTRPAWLSLVASRLAELRRRQGRLDEARSLLEGFDQDPGAIAVLAEIALDRGEPAEATALAHRFFIAIPERNRIERSAGLAILARAQAAAGDLEAARVSTRELAESAEILGTDGLVATARHVEGSVALAGGDLTGARAALEAAVLLFTRSGTPYEAGRARADLADALRSLGDTARADEEAARGAEILRALGVAPDRAKRGSLTAREAEVIALVAQGRTDREIAAALTLSEHTVHRHVANIMAKLAVSSRSAAVAEAAREGLI